MAERLIARIAGLGALAAQLRFMDLKRLGLQKVPWTDNIPLCHEYAFTRLIQGGTADRRKREERELSAV